MTILRSPKKMRKRLYTLSSASQEDQNYHYSKRGHYFRVFNQVHNNQIRRPWKQQNTVQTWSFFSQTKIGACGDPCVLHSFARCRRVVNLPKRIRPAIQIWCPFTEIVGLLPIFKVPAQLLPRVTSGCMCG